MLAHEKSASVKALAGPCGRVRVRPVAGFIGADIHGVDLAGPLGDATVAAVRAALLRWKVVFFRDQKLNHAAHVALAREQGWTWEQIGDALGVSRQSIHIKYRR